MSDADSSLVRRALVTGASAGIGAAFARRLAARGADLVLVARRADRLEALAKELEADHGGSVEVLAADLCDAGDLTRVERRLGAEPVIDLLVNNAGFGTAGLYEKSDRAAETREIQLNVLALARLCHAALPGLLGRGAGGIINVSSLAGWLPGPRTATYNATKAFVTSFSEGLHAEVRDRGVTVQVLCPGFTRTEFQDVAGVDKNEVPGFMWMEAPDVVDASLASYARRDVVCVPGAINRLSAAAVGLLPRALLRRGASAMTVRLDRSEQEKRS